MYTKDMEPLTPQYTRSLGKRDGRTKEARLLRDIRAELASEYSPFGIRARLLVEQAAALKLRLALCDITSTDDNDNYIELTQALTCILRELSTECVPTGTPTSARI